MKGERDVQICCNDFGNHLPDHRGRRKRRGGVRESRKAGKPEIANSIKLRITAFKTKRLRLWKNPDGKGGMTKVRRAQIPITKFVREQGGIPVTAIANKIMYRISFKEKAGVRNYTGWIAARFVVTDRPPVRLKIDCNQVIAMNNAPGPTRLLDEATRCKK